MEIYVHEETCERCGRVSDALKKTEFMFRATNKNMELCDSCIEDLKNKFTMQNNRLAMLYFKNVNRFVAQPRCAVCSGSGEELCLYRFDIAGYVYELELCQNCFSNIMTIYRGFSWELPVEKLSLSRGAAKEAKVF